MRNAVSISPPSAPAALDDHAAVDNEQIVRAGPLVWHVRPAWADRVPAGGPADWTDLSDCPDAQLIKRNAQRSPGLPGPINYPTPHQVRRPVQATTIVCLMVRQSSR